MACPNNRWLIAPAAAGGPTPQNCLGNTLGEEKWIMPPANVAVGGNTPRPGSVPNDFVEMQVTNAGYKREMGPPTPGDLKCWIALVFCSHTGTCKDKEWKHSMKRDPSGKWQSKDGEASLYELGDEDFNNHLDDLKLCKMGEMRIVKYYSK